MKKLFLTLLLCEFSLSAFSQTQPYGRIGYDGVQALPQSTVHWPIGTYQWDNASGATNFWLSNGIPYLGVIQLTNSSSGGGSIYATFLTGSGANPSTNIVAVQGITDTNRTTGAYTKIIGGDYLSTNISSGSFTHADTNGNFTATGSGTFDASNLKTNTFGGLLSILGNRVQEGSATTATSPGGHAEGNGTTASAGQSHAEGNGTFALASNAHSEGNATTASGANSHAEGFGTLASAPQAHAEGNNTTASGTNSWAGGDNSSATQTHSYVWSDGTSATSPSNNTYTVTATNGIYLNGPIYGTGTNLSGVLTTNANSLSSAQLNVMLTDETGSGAQVAANSPTLNSPTLNNPTGIIFDGTRAYINPQAYGAVPDTNYWQEYKTGTPSSHLIMGCDSAFSNSMFIAKGLVAQGYLTTVSIPYGIYRFTNDGIYVPQGVYISGVGQLINNSGSAGTKTNGATVLWMDNTNASGLIYNNHNDRHTMLSNIEIDGLTNCLQSATLDISTPIINMNKGIGIYVGDTNSTYSQDFSAQNVTIRGFRAGVWDEANYNNFDRIQFTADSYGFVSGGTTNFTDYVSVGFGDITNIGNIRTRYNQGLCPVPDQTIFTHSGLIDCTNMVGYVLTATHAVYIESASDILYHNFAWVDGSFLTIKNAHSEFDDSTATNLIVLFGNNNGIAAENNVFSSGGNNAPCFSFYHGFQGSTVVYGYSLNTAIVQGEPGYSKDPLLRQIVEDWENDGSTYLNLYGIDAQGIIQRTDFQTGYVPVPASPQTANIIPQQYQPARGSGRANINPNVSYGLFGLAYDTANGQDYPMFYGGHQGTNNYDRAELVAYDEDLQSGGYASTTLPRNVGTTWPINQFVSTSQTSTSLTNTGNAMFKGVDNVLSSIATNSLYPSGWAITIAGHVTYWTNNAAWPGGAWFNDILGANPVIGSDGSANIQVYAYPDFHALATFQGGAYVQNSPLQLDNGSGDAKLEVGNTSSVFDAYAVISSDGWTDSVNSTVFFMGSAYNTGTHNVVYSMFGPTLGRVGFLGKSYDFSIGTDGNIPAPTANEIASFVNQANVRVAVVDTNGLFTGKIIGTNIVSTFVQTNWVSNKIYTNQSLAKETVYSDEFVVSAALGNTGFRLLYDPAGGTAWQTNCDAVTIQVATSIVGMTNPNRLVGPIPIGATFVFSNFSTVGSATLNNGFLTIP